MWKKNRCDSYIKIGSMGLFWPRAETKTAVRSLISEQNRVPPVWFDRLVSRRSNQVGVENKRAIKELVEHLYNLGHRRIAMIAGRPHVATTFERVEAYKRTLRDHGLPVDEAMIQAGGEEAESFHRLLALKRPPTAILAGNHRSMSRVIQYLHVTGLRVPRDIAAVGFDDFEWGDYFHPRLTVIVRPLDAL